jgi:hypothetical protein
MTTRAAVTVVAAFLAVSPIVSSAQAVHVGGMASARGTGQFDNGFEPSLGLRFLPEMTLKTDPKRPAAFDADISANVFGTVSFPPDGASESSGDVKAYRAWLRVSASGFEARAGLQQISFGSATIFRPLMWFDTLDPRDPLQLTEGVYALLLRYDTKSNASFSAWTMYGNDSQRGWDAFPPDDKTPEFGGRAQFPLPRGELGAAYHHRKADIASLLPVSDPVPPAAVAPVPEDRVGVDGKWDLGVGVWFEGALVHQDTPLLPRPYQLTLDAGFDYTFKVGNGLTVLAEQFRFSSSDHAFSGGQSQSLSGLLVRYPLGLLDELTCIFYYDWKAGNGYRFFAWKRTYDALSFNASVFWNPGELSVFPGKATTSSYAGTGFELLLSYHF